MGMFVGCVVNTIRDKIRNENIFTEISVAYIEEKMRENNL